MEKNKLYVIAGPTGVGKTKLSIMLAKRMDGEIVSADSMQIYKGMDIGTAKVTKEEMNKIPHHMIDIVAPDKDFSIYEFQKIARDRIADILSRGKTPILVGGTGFYIQAVIRDVRFATENIDKSYRKALELISEFEGGKEALFELLSNIDPSSAKVIHKNNVKRVIRALEFYEENGYSIQKHNDEEAVRDYIYDVDMFVLTDERERIYKRIDDRVDVMVASGLVDEVSSLIKCYGKLATTASQAIGYREIIEFIEGKFDIRRAVELIKQNSRHYAKRQLTWFKREKIAKYIDISKYNDFNEIVDEIIQHKEEV